MKLIQICCIPAILQAKLVQHNLVNNLAQQTKPKIYDEVINGYSFKIQFQDPAENKQKQIQADDQKEVEDIIRKVAKQNSYESKISEGIINQVKQKVNNDIKTKKITNNGNDVADADIKEEIRPYDYFIKWDHTPEQIIKNTNDIIQVMNNTVNNIVALTEKRTFENTIIPIADMQAQSQMKDPLFFYSKVHPDKQIREASKKAEDIYDDFSNDFHLRKDFYQAIKQYYDEAVQDGSHQNVDAEGQRFVNKTIYDFESNGVNLSEDKRIKIKALNKQIDTIAKKATENIKEDKSVIEVPVKSLENLQKDNIEKLQKTKEGYVNVPTKSPQIDSALVLSDDPEFRKSMKIAKDNKLAEKNVPLLEELITLRQELAILLGYTSFGQMTLDGMMANNVETVMDFEDNLREFLVPRAKKEIKDVNEKSTSKHKKVKNMEIKDWDFAYYRNEYSLDKNDNDNNRVEKYFPMDHIKQQVLEIYQELLGLQFKEIKDDKSKWHPDIFHYEVKDAESQKVIGTFYMDLFPRPDKYNHAAVFQLIKRSMIDGKLRYPTVAMVTNFKAPTKEKPSLLGHGEVSTFFHEFGHIMHNMCSEANYTKFSGTAVERDFVEMPSQMLENWIYNYEILKRLSKHHITGKQMPDNEIQSIIQGQNDLNAVHTLHAIFQGTYDLLIYSAFDKQLLSNPQKLKPGFMDINSLRKGIKIKNGNTVDTQDLWYQLQEKIDLTEMLPGTNPQATFGHIIEGYSSQYYSYLWSKVYSCDIFQQFKKKGLLDKETGMRYRKIILAPGGTRDSIEGLREFLGREPNNEAFLQMQGFTQ